MTNKKIDYIDTYVGEPDDVHKMTSTCSAKIEVDVPDLTPKAVKIDLSKKFIDAVKKPITYFAIPFALTFGSCVEPTLTNGEADYHSTAISHGLLTHYFLRDSNGDSIPDYIDHNYLAIDTTVHGSNPDYINKKTLKLGPEDFKVFQKTNEYVNKSLRIIDN